MKAARRESDDGLEAALTSDGSAVLRAGGVSSALLETTAAEIKAMNRILDAFATQP